MAVVNWVEAAVLVPLLISGEREAAVDLIRRIWDSASQLKAQLKKGEISTTTPSLIPLLVWLDVDPARESLEAVTQGEAEERVATEEMIWYLALVD